MGQGELRLGWADVELYGPVKYGELRLGMVWHGSQGKSRQCKVCHGTAGNGKAVGVWYDMARQSKVGCGSARWCRVGQGSLG